MLLNSYQEVRERTIRICLPLQIEDYVVQPVVDVSPPKWHLGHTAWFFETFMLLPFLKGYRVFDPDYNYVFNSYYETVGARVIRTDRGNLTRPTVQDVYHYRQHVDEGMATLLQQDLSPEQEEIFWLGINHEQQHQELLITDIKYILGHNPLFPAVQIGLPETGAADPDFVMVPEGLYEVGFHGEGFCFDNELDRHKVYLGAYSIQRSAITNRDYLDFINDNGYGDFRHWHQEGWEWVRKDNVRAPMHWHRVNDQWYQYTFGGLTALDPDEPLCHVNFYEASAFAQWRGMRLPTEFEWEVAAPSLQWGDRWEWTNSAYLPYPGYKRQAGALGEYNGKFMVSQMVLRGASVATSPGHSRMTYRNFFHPGLQWQFTGIRLAK